MVLGSLGFDASPATIPEVAELFSAGPYSLVILCATLTKEEKLSVRVSSSAAPMFLETGLILTPQELLKVVRDRLRV